jgi:hypothetical protein
MRGRKMKSRGKFYTFTLKAKDAWGHPYEILLTAESRKNLELMKSRYMKEVFGSDE